MSHDPDTDRILRIMELGQRLASVRQKRGLTQKQFSELVGKSRATIVQYEQGRLHPPIQQIETMAKVLDVPPELIAFGRLGLNGLNSESADVTSLPEVELTDGKETIGGGHGLGHKLVAHLGVEPDTSRIYVLANAAPAFGFAKGDRVIVNQQTDLVHDHRLYAFRTRSGVAVARLLARLSTSSSRVNLNGGDGGTTSHEPAELDVLGVIVGAIQAR